MFYKEKMKYFKNLTKAILQSKNSQVFNINHINEVLLSLRVTSENLEQHKEAIRFLLDMNNEKRRNIYELKTQIQIQDKEINFWIVDYPLIKNDLKIRDKIEKLNFLEIEKEVTKEISDKPQEIGNKVLVKNADRYMLASGYKNFFYEQKQFYVSEIEKLSSHNSKLGLKKKKLTEELIKITMDSDLKINNLMIENNELKTKVFVAKTNKEVQTSIDLSLINEMDKVYDDVKYLKFLVFY